MAKGKKGKRKMSGWQCYLKTCAKGKSFQDCIGDNDRKTKEYEPKKDYWSGLASEGCPL